MKFAYGEYFKSVREADTTTVHYTLSTVNCKRRCVFIFTRTPLAPGVYFGKITDGRFKTNRIKIRLFTDFDALPREDAALAAYCLSECCEAFPDYSKLSARLLDLYDASLSSSTTCVWDKRCTEITAAALDDRYALCGEKLEKELAVLLAQCLFRPKASDGAFDGKMTEMMRAELIDSIDSVINDKAHYAAQNAAKTAFVGEAQELPAEGLHENAEKVTAESAFAAYQKMLETAHVEITAAGCSDFAETEKILADGFSKIKRLGSEQLSCLPSKIKSEPARVSDRLEMQQAILRVYFKAGKITDRPANMLFTRILGGMTTSRFFTNIREKQSLCYYCSAYTDRFKGTLVCYAGIEPKNAALVEEAIKAELSNIAKNGVTDEELFFAKQEILDSLRSVGDSVGGISSWYFGQTIDDVTYSPEEYAKEVEAVTAERVKQAAAKYALDTVYCLKGS